MYSLLIVDDEKVICEGIKHRIMKLGIPGLGRIDIAFNGNEAMTLACQSPPDIVITDIKMPEMGGLELIEALAKINPHIKLIVISGYDLYDYIRSAFKLGVIDYLLKPVSTEDLKYHLESAIAKLNQEKEESPVKSGADDENTEILAAQLIFSQYMQPKVQDKLVAKLATLLPHPFFAIGIVAIDFSLENGKEIAFVSEQLELLKQSKVYSSISVTCLFNPTNYPVLVFSFPKKAD